MLDDFKEESGRITKQNTPLLAVDVVHRRGEIDALVRSHVLLFSAALELVHVC